MSVENQQQSISIKIALIDVKKKLFLTKLNQGYLQRDALKVEDPIKYPIHIQIIGLVLKLKKKWIWI